MQPLRERRRLIHSGDDFDPTFIKLVRTDAVDGGQGVGEVVG